MRRDNTRKPGRVGSTCFSQYILAELDDDEDTRKLREEKYSYMENIAKSVKYQYILNMNQSILKF